MANKHKKQNLNLNLFSSEQEIRDHIDELWDKPQSCWENIICHSVLSEQFIREFKEKLPITFIVYYQKLSKDFVRELLEECDNDKIFWRNFCSSENISNEYFNEFRHILHWTNILDDRCSVIKVEEVEKYFYDILEYTTSKNAYDWELTSLSKYPHLTEQFCRKHSFWLDWNFISCYQKLSEQFIEEMSDKVNWECISSSQKLSEKFILKHKDKLDWWKLTKNENIAPYIRKKVQSGYYRFEIKGTKK